MHSLPYLLSYLLTYYRPAGIVSMIGVIVFDTVLFSVSAVHAVIISDCCFTPCIGSGALSCSVGPKCRHKLESLA